MLKKYRFFYVIILSVIVLGKYFNIVPSFTEYALASRQNSDFPTLVINTPANVTYTLTAGASELPRVLITTHTPWTEGVQEFSGITLKTLLEAAGLDEKTIRQSKIKARALNDYEVEIPGQDAYDYNVLVADQMNGEVMPITDFGPFWIVYPRDDNTELQDSRFDQRWAWQLSELIVE